MSQRVPPELEARIELALQEKRTTGESYHSIAQRFGVGDSTVHRIAKDPNRGKLTHGNPIVTESYQDNSGVVLVKSLNISTLEQALAYSKVDLAVWEVDRYTINSWESTLGTKSDKPLTVTNYQVKVWLRRKDPKQAAWERLLLEIRRARPLLKAIRFPKPKQYVKRMLEVSIFDIHLGLRCFPPGADGKQTVDGSVQLILSILERLLLASKVYAPYEYILLPMGNDFFHCDNIWGTTTAGTPQPEAESWHYVYTIGERLAIAMIERVKQEAPVKVVLVPGNHARQTEFTLGRFLDAYYRNDPNVEVDASASPYKFVHYGVNLIGYDHGHSVKPVRLAAVMANECRDVWGETVYREWHCGDQHRKGSSKPMMLEEQGVSVEYLPGLVTPNEWHRLKSYNWQKRAGLAFVWDKGAGPTDRFQVNVNSYTGEIMG